MAFGFFRPEEMTPEGIARRRAMAQQMLAPRRQAPRGVWGGASAATDKIIGALLMRQADAREREARAKLDPTSAAMNEAVLRALGVGGQYGSGVVPQEAGDAPVMAMAPRDAIQETPLPPPVPEHMAPVVAAVDRAQDFNQRLAMSESGGDPSIVNKEGYTGLYQWGPDRLADYNRATGQNVTMEQFRASPEIQQAAQNWHIQDIDRFIDERGLDQAVGQEIGGVPITRDGLRAMAHLGGNEGMAKFVETGGQYNPSDSLGTSLADYGRKFGTASTAAQGAAAAPVTHPTAGQAAAPDFSAAMQPALEILNSEFASPGQRALAQAIVNRQLSLGQSGMNEYQRASLRLRERELIGRETGRIAAPGAVTVSMEKGETAWQQEGAKETAKMLSGMTEQGIAAQGELGQIGEMERLIQTEGVGGTTDAWSAWAKNNFGINMTTGPVQAFEAITNRLVPSQRPPGSGQMSDRDVELFKRSLPQLINTPDGNQMILRTMRGMAEFKRRQGEIAQQAMIGRISRQEALEQLYAIPDPLAEFRAARETGELPTAEAPAETPAETAAPMPEGVPPVPEGIDIDPAEWPHLWQQMTPDQRALWQN